MNNVFSILRDIVDSGHLADMSGTEAKAVLAFLYYSNFDGSNAYPAMASIAEKIGAASSHWARRAVHSLEARTILATTNDSKGRNTKTRCLQSPTKPPSNRSTKCTSSTGTESEPVQKVNRYRKCAPTGTVFKRQPVQKLYPNPPMTHPLPYISPAADAAERERLEEIYRAYPKHVGKPKALQAIASAVKRLRKERPELDALAYLKQRTEAFAKVRQRIHEADKTQERFTPHPSTWFHQSRYDDDESTWGNAGGNGKHNGASPHSVGPSLTRPVYRS